MIPQILHIGSIPLNSFGLMLALAFIAASLMLSNTFRRLGLAEDLAESVVFLGAISGVLGARVWYMLFHLQELEGGFFSNIISSAGFTFYGGFIFAGLSVVAFAIYKKIPVHILADALAPALALGYSIGRIGCQLSGDGDYGKVTDSFLGMSYASGVVPTEIGTLVYPTPAIESVLALFVALLLVVLGQREYWKAPYRLFGTYLVLMGLERFLIEFIRIEPRYAFGFSEAQFFALALVPLGFYLLFRKKAKQLQS